MAKSKKKLLKRVAGIKVPKPFRKGARRFLASQDGRTLLLEALAVTAAMAAGAAGRKAAGRGLKAPSLGAPASAIGAATSYSTAFSDALGVGVRAFTEALRRGKVKADAEAAWPPIDDDSVPEPRRAKAKEGENKH